MAIQIEEQGNGVLFNGVLTDKQGWVLSPSSDQTKVVLTNRITGLSGSSDVTEVEVDGNTFADYDALVAALGSVIFRTGGSGPGPEPGGDASTLNGEPGSYYRNRANHTGTQAISTVAGLQSELDDRPTNDDLGTAAFEDSGAFATAAQGARADTAVQTEIDPTVPAHVKSISSANISTWNGKQDALSVVPQSEAEAGTATTARSWSAQRDRQAIVAASRLIVSVSANKTLALNDEYTYQRVTAAATITIPTSASVALPVGAVIDFFQAGSGAITFSPASGVTVNSYEDTLVTDGKGAAATLKKVAANEWDLII